MKVRDLIAALDDLRAVFAAGAAKSQAKNMQSFTEALKRHENESASDLIVRLRDSLESPKAPSKKPSGLPNADIVTEYSSKLNAAQDDEAAFGEIVEALQKNKNVRVAEAAAIAAAYTGGLSKCRTKKDAIRSIKATFNERAYEKVKMLRVDKGSRF